MDWKKVGQEYVLAAKELFDETTVAYVLLSITIVASFVSVVWVAALVVAYLEKGV